MEDFVQFIDKEHGEKNWVSLYKNISVEDESMDGSLYCSLVSKEASSAAMNEFGWDLMLGNGRPSMCISSLKGQKVVTYISGKDEEFIPLVIYREFDGRKDNYLEISEEFRLFHNLYYDVKNSKFIDFDDVGDEIDVVKMVEDEITVRRSYLHSFLAAKQMNLLLYFELTKHFTKSANEKGEVKSSRLSYVKYSGESYAKGYTGFVRVLGKKLILCSPMEDCGVWPFEKKKNYEDFIIGGDIDAPISFTSNPDLLANYFGANPNAPHYLTAVFFKKEVMLKYYNSSEYEISDGYLTRRGAWQLRFDNNSSNHISVFLGDLGKNLPHKEQTYWKSYNIVPDGHQISEPNFKRSFLAQFCDSSNPEFIFKPRFEMLQKISVEKLGWPIFQPLKEKDTHFYASIRSLLTNEQAEFDSQVLALAKVTLDSINVKELKLHLKTPAEDKITPIGLLDLLFQQLVLDDIPSKVEFLRGLQSLRSTGVAHRKGTEYDKVIKKLAIDDGNYMAEFDKILLVFAGILSDFGQKL